MKTEFLKDLGLTQELIDQVMAENGKDIEAEKAKTIAKEGELTKANETVKGLQDGIKKFDGVDIEKLKADAAAWETKYNDDVKAAKAESEKLRKEFGLKESLKTIGVTDPDYIIYKHGGVDKFAFDSDGKTVGLEDILKPYKESSPALFKVNEPVKADAPLVFSSGLPHGAAPAAGGEMKFNFMGVRPMQKE